MLAYIKGTVEVIGEDSCVLECNGIGYQVYSSTEVLSHLSLGTSIKLHIYMSVKEDGVSLFGFLNEAELKVFKLLIGVSGIGPKGALSIMSVLSVDELRMAVISDDFKAISKANGIGPKTAQRAVIELKDKFKLEDVFMTSIADDMAVNANVDITPNTGDTIKEAALALTSLGYSNIEAMKAIKKLGDVSGLSVEEVIKQALKKMI